ncbi:MAG: gliding motility-associated C-terminal domain-containing protein [Lewinellaceae bacterium]|nr:gliding motility-associated C-terminal domain-containing protein [Lewinellaceae bacterium]
MKQLALVIPLLCLALALQAQPPFVCRGNFYLVITPQSSSSLYEVTIDATTGNVVFQDLPASGMGFTLNGIGYRSVDNYIYGVDHLSGWLYRIDGNGAATFLAIPTAANPAYTYPAGDVSPDGKYLVVMSVANNHNSALLKIDLESPTFASQSISVSGVNTLCYDISFDPLDGTLYGWDSGGSRLVVIDPATGYITAPFPSTPNTGTLGSFFVDAFGNLYGYGQQGFGGSQNTLFQFDKATGQATILTTGPAAGRTDGCSCPYTLEMIKRVNPLETVPCTELTYDFEIANSSGRTQEGLAFEDQFPEDFRITAINNPFGGTVTGGLGTNSLRIEGLSIPPGIHIIRVKVEVLPNALGTYKNQASLSGLPQELGGTVLSDNPLTVVQEDSTVVRINPLEIDFSEVHTAFCSGQQVVIDPSVHGVNYLWSDGSTEPLLTVAEGGTYAVTVSSGCDTDIESITITEQETEVELGPDLELYLGDSLQLFPDIIGLPPYSYHWASEVEGLSCTSCAEPFTRPYQSGMYYLDVRGANGCTALDSVFIRVVKDLNVYIPNAFSPNDDGRNDRFFPNSRKPQFLHTFKIFSRWGELLFDGDGGWTNDSRSGWDGTFEGKPMNPGVYAYLIVVEFLDGERMVFSGDVHLVR